MITESPEESPFHSLALLHSDVQEIKAVLKELSTAVTKLAIVEVRQMDMTNQVGRAFTLLDRLDLRIGALEKEAPITARLSRWAERLLLAGSGAMLLYIAKHVGLI